jgi:hemerythrin-like metal-binding protein
MSLIVWRKEFETGVADVDHEHQELVGLINALHDEIGKGGDRENLSAFLGEVFARIASHFALEESIMRKHRYDEYEAHKADHERLLDEIRDIMDRHDEGHFEDASQALATTVHDWFVNHFKTKDARLHGKLGI